MAVLREVLAQRKPPKDLASDGGLLFVTKYGKRWYDGTPANPASKEVAKVLEAAGVRRKGLSLYAARHTFETVAGGARDQVAVDLVMGHARDNDMASVYRERIEDETGRLTALADHVRRWLYVGPWPQK